MASLFDCVSPKSRRIKRKQKQAKVLNNGVGVNPTADSDDSDDAYTASPKLQDKHATAKQVQEAGAQDATSADVGANSRQQQQQLQSNTVSSTTPSEQATTTVRQESQQLAVTAVNNDADRTEPRGEQSANRNDAPQTVNDDVVTAATHDVIIEVDAYKVKSVGSGVTAVANDDRTPREARSDAAAPPLPASNGDVLTANGREARVSGADASPQRVATGVRDPVSAVFMNQVSTTLGSAAAAARPAYRALSILLVALCQSRAVLGKH